MNRMAKITIVDKAPTRKRYGDLASGELFYACGDIAIKTAGEDAVVLKDGNYVLRNSDDYVEVVEYAELHVRKCIKKEPKPAYRSPLSSYFCKYYNRLPETSEIGTCNSESGTMQSIRFVRCGGRCDKCETDRFDCE